MLRKVRNSLSGASGPVTPNQKVEIKDRDTSSISSDDSSDSSLGFGDFENGTIYDQIVKMDSNTSVERSQNEIDDNTSIEAHMNGNAIANAGQGSNIHNLRVQESTGVVIGNQTFIEGTVIFDRFGHDDSFVSALQQKLGITNGNEGNGNLNNIKSNTGQDNCDSSEIKIKESLNTKSSFRRKCCIFSVILGVIVVLVIGGLLIFQFMGPGFHFNDPTESPSTSSSEPSTVTSTETESTTKSTEGPSSTESTTSTIAPPRNYTTVNRTEWGTSQPYDCETIPHPVKQIVITETGTNPCNSLQTCSTTVRNEQKKFLNTGFSDIGYSFMSAGDNAIYEGCGWDFSGQHSNPKGSNCFYIAFIGNFKNIRPSEGQIEAYFALIEDGVRKKYIDENYEMVAYCQIAPSSRPQKALYELVKTWPHWNGNTTRQCD